MKRKEIFKKTRKEKQKKKVEVKRSSRSVQ